MNYEMGGTILSKTVKEKDLGVDTKLFIKLRNLEIKKLQDYIDKLVRWSEKLQMLFNFGKCKCLHTGPGNTGTNHEMGGTILSKTIKDKHLGNNEC